MNGGQLATLLCYVRNYDGYIEWAIDFRTLFEDTCAKPRDNTGKNNCAVYFKGIAIASCMAHIEDHLSFLSEIRESEDFAPDHPLSNINMHQRTPA